MKVDRKKFMHTFVNIALALIALNIIVGVFSYLRFVQREMVDGEIAVVEDTEQEVPLPVEEPVQEDLVPEPEEIEEALPKEPEQRIVKQEDSYTFWIKSKEQECKIAIQLLSYRARTGEATVILENKGNDDIDNITVIFNNDTVSSLQGTTVKPSESVEFNRTLFKGVHTVRVFSTNCSYNGTIEIGG